MRDYYINVIQWSYQAASRKVLQPDELGPVGQEVEGVPQHHGLHVGDNADLWPML